MNWERYNTLVALRDSGHIEESMAGLAELFEEDSEPLNKALVLIEIANGLRLLKRRSEARHRLGAACELLGPKHEYYPRAAFQAALIDMDEENWKGALRKLDDILEHHANVLKTEDHKDLFEEVQRRRGMALTKLGRFGEARPLLESVRGIEYDRIATLSYLGVCDFELKDWNAALDVYEALLSIEPDYSVFHAYANYHRGIILFHRGQLARAKSEFEQCLVCPDRGDISDNNLLTWLTDTCNGLNLSKEAARYAGMLRKDNGSSVGR
jgi:tetratricopeptide (TPR) repeat protein